MAFMAFGAAFFLACFIAFMTFMVFGAMMKNEWKDWMCETFGNGSEMVRAVRKRFGNGSWPFLGVLLSPKDDNHDHVSCRIWTGHEEVRLNGQVFCLPAFKRRVYRGVIWPATRCVSSWAPINGWIMDIVTKTQRFGHGLFPNSLCISKGNIKGRWWRTCCAF